MTFDSLPPPEALPLPTPTIRRVVASILACNADRSVIVRNPSPERLAGLMVFCLGEKAMSEILPTLVEASDSLNQLPRREPLELSVDEDLAAVFTWMETTGLSWFKLSVEPHDVRAMVYAFIGNDVCRQLAPKLTKLGAPVNMKGAGQ